MAYREPGTEVSQEFTAAAANIQASEQAVTIVGEFYEVFEDEVHSQSYDPVSGAGAQSFDWPGKKATSVVDLSGVRKSIAEVDSQLNEYADYPLAWSLRDPSTNQVFDVDPLTEVYSIDQDGFTIVEGVTEAVARSAGDNASAAQNREFNLRPGGFITAGVVTGDRIRLTNGTFDVRGEVDVSQDDHVFYTPDGHDLTVKTAVLAGATTLVAEVSNPVTLLTSGRLLVGSGATLELVEYSGLAVVSNEHTFTVGALAFAHAVGENVRVEVVDSASVASVDGDLSTSSGYIESATGGLTDKDGARVAIWVESIQVNDGAAAGGDNIIQSTTLGIDYTYVGNKITVWSSDAGDGAATQADGDLDAVSGQLASALASFTDADVGKPIKIGTDYRRITSRIDANTITYSGTALTGTGITYIVYGQVTRTIMSVNSTTGDVTVDGANLNAGTALPVVVHRPIYRDLEDDSSNSDTKIRYSGSAVSSDTGFLKRTPFDVFEEDLTYEIYPSYELLVTYRALDIANVNDQFTIYSSTDISALGQAVVANPLLWAAQAAIVAMGTDDTPVLLQSIDLWADEDPGDKTGYPEDQNEALGYLNALELLAQLSSVYYMVPLTRNATVRDAFVTHVLAQSEPCEKNERICYLTYALPLGDVESTTGTVAPGLDGGNKEVSDPGQNFLSEHQVIPGNEVVIVAPAVYAGEYTVASGSTEDSLVLSGDNWGQTSGVYDDSVKEFTVENADTSTAGEVDTATAEAWKDVEVGDYVLQGTATRRITNITTGSGGAYTKLEYEGLDLPVLGVSQTISVIRTSVGVEYYVRPLDKSEQASALAAISQARGSRRVVHMWPDEVEMVTGTDSQGQDVEENVSSIYAAAAEAGRDSVLRPERSSTGETLAGFTALEHSNFYFNRTQLNTIAGGGWSILHQPTRGGSVKMRHLLTTDVSSVKTQEVSITKNIDNMAKVKRESMNPLLNDDNGRVNITTQFLTNLAAPAQGVFEKFVAKEQLVRTDTAEPYRILRIVQDPTLEDAILEDAEINVPKPGNNLDVTFII